MNRSDYSIVLNGLSSLDTVDTDTVAITVTVAVAVLEADTTLSSSILNWIWKVICK